MKDYVKNKGSSYLIYWDVKSPNELSQNVSLGCSEWV